MEIVTIVKFISLIVAAGFAILGTTTDYKKEGQVTRWGRVAIIGVILSGLLSSSLLGMEEAKKARDKVTADADKIDAQRVATQEKQALYDRFDQLFGGMETAVTNTAENLKQTDKVNEAVRSSVETQGELLEQTTGISSDVDKSLAEQQKVLKTTGEVQAGQRLVLTNTTRTLLPLRESEFAITYTLSVPLEHRAFRAYRERIEKLAKERIAAGEDALIERDMTITLDDDGSGSIDRIRIRPNSPLLPSATDNSEKAAARFVRDDPIFSVYANQTAEAFRADRPEEADLRFQPSFDATERSSFEGADAPPTTPRFYIKSISFEYGDSMRIFIRTTTNQFGYWDNNSGRLVGVVDLRDSVLVAESMGLQEQLRYFTLSVGDNHSWNFTIYSCEPFGAKTICEIQSSDIPLS